MISYELIPYLGLPILKIKTDELLTDDELKFLKDLSKITYVDDSFTFDLTRSDNILNNKELTRVKVMIQKYFDEYVTNTLQIDNKFYMCNSWATIQRRGNAHPNHAHPNAIFSSVFYVAAKDSKIIFTTKRPSIQEGFNFDYNIIEWNIFNSPTWKLPVETGDIIIFPGQMQHESAMYTGDEERIMIGSSYFLTGTVGTEETYNTLHLAQPAFSTFLK